MAKQNLDKQYNQMLAKIEKAGIYDGRGTYDLYECSSCGSKMITTYKDKGVTPFITKCKCCIKGYMKHTKTYKEVSSDTKVQNWVRPTLEQTKRLPQLLHQHILNGGLMLESELEILK